MIRTPFGYIEEYVDHAGKDRWRGVFDPQQHTQSPEHDNFWLFSRTRESLNSLMKAICEAKIEIYKDAIDEFNKGG